MAACKFFFILNKLNWFEIPRAINLRLFVYNGISEEQRGSYFRQYDAKYKIYFNIRQNDEYYFLTFLLGGLGCRKTGKNACIDVQL